VRDRLDEVKRMTPAERALAAKMAQMRGAQGIE
jgi:hypothetical protein